MLLAVPFQVSRGADAGGQISGFSAPGGRATELRLLKIEGALGAETLPLFQAPA